MDSSPDHNLTIDRRGAYGLTLISHHDHGYSAERLVRAPDHWPAWQVEWHCPDPSDRAGAEDFLDDARAVALLAGGGVARIERAAARTRLSLPAPPSADSLLHPHLAITALVAGGWLGRRTFHSGSFVRDGGVWAVLGERGQGKSSTLAWLASVGVPVLADDLLVLDGDTALAGPRVLDLRAPAARHFGIGRELGVVGTRERWRVDLPEIAPALPFRGWVVLEWGGDDEPVAVDAVPMAERLPRLVAARGVHIAEPSTAQWLPIIARPMLRLRRPRDWSKLDDAMATLLRAVDAG